MMTTIDARDVRAGDIVLYRGERHRVARIDHRRGWAWPVASDGFGWAMALGGSIVIAARGAH